MLVSSSCLNRASVNPRYWLMPASKAGEMRALYATCVESESYATLHQVLRPVQHTLAGLPAHNDRPWPSRSVSDWAAPGPILDLAGPLTLLSEQSQVRRR